MAIKHLLLSNKSHKNVPNKLLPTYWVNMLETFSNNIKG